MSQIPALLELVNLGYTYIPRADISKLREGTSQYVLRDIAFDALRKISGDSISDKSIKDAIFEAENNIDMGGGVFRASEEVFSLMLAGRSVSELVNGRRTSPQILIATNVRELKYGTMLTPQKFYAHWKEKDADQEKHDAEVAEIINKPVKPNVVKQIADDLIRQAYKQALNRQVTEQDRGIYSLLRPDRILDLTRNFILYDNNIKKIARYPQYFAIKKSLKRLKTFDDSGKRRGGLIWHTQGTGKSLTMVMLVKCLIDDQDIVLPRVLVVTDRRDLDKQISDTFAACNIKKNVKRTTSAKELLGLIKEKDQRIIIALIHKFEASKAARDFIDEDPNIFVLIDEAHRTQAGKANIELNMVLPKACQIAFTGTPLMKREKTSEAKFGGIIDAYTISEAEADGISGGFWTNMCRRNMWWNSRSRCV